MHSKSKKTHRGHNNYGYIHKMYVQVMHQNNRMLKTWVNRSGMINPITVVLYSHDSE